MLPTVWTSFHLRKLFQACNNRPSILPTFLALLSHAAYSWRGAATPARFTYHSATALSNGSSTEPLLVLHISPSNTPSFSLEITFLTLIEKPTRLTPRDASSAATAINLAITPTSQDLHALDRLLQVPLCIGSVHFTGSPLESLTLPAAAINYLKNHLQQQIAFLSWSPQLNPQVDVSLVLLSTNTAHITLLAQKIRPNPATTSFMRSFDPEKPETLDITEPLLQLILRTLLPHLLRLSIQSLFRVPYPEQHSFFVLHPDHSDPLYVRIHHHNSATRTNVSISHTHLHPPRQSLPLNTPSELTHLVQILQQSYSHLSQIALRC